MNTSWKLVLWGTVLLLLTLSAWLLYLYRSAQGQVSAVDSGGVAPLRVIVTDPLSSALCSTSAGDLARRDYSRLGAYLTRKIDRPVELSYAKTLPEVLASKSGQIDLIIGKASAVRSEAAQANANVRPLVRLTDGEGEADLTGLFIVRKNDPARTMKDLADYRILFGLAGDDERHSAALATLAEHGVTPVPPLQMAASNTAAALAVIEGAADAAVISGYAAPLIDGCDGVDKGALRVIGRTAPVPFITVFATAQVTQTAERAIVDALLGVANDPPLLEALSSKAGFV
jgi:ABC-type phosphate/phosphonate transport system substrate-binding protein